MGADVLRVHTITVTAPPPLSQRRCAPSICKRRGIAGDLRHRVGVRRRQVEGRPAGTRSWSFIDTPGCQMTSCGLLRSRHLDRALSRAGVMREFCGRRTPRPHGSVWGQPSVSDGDRLAGTWIHVRETPNVAIDYSVDYQRDELQSLQLIDRVEGVRGTRVGSREITAVHIVPTSQFYICGIIGP